MATIAQLAARKAKLEAELRKVNAEIKARHGEVDPPAEAPAKQGTKQDQ